MRSSSAEVWPARPPPPPPHCLDPLSLGSKQAALISVAPSLGREDTVLLEKAKAKDQRAAEIEEKQKILDQDEKSSFKRRKME